MAARNGEFQQHCSELLTAFGKRRPIRTGSLVISVFGDAIAPHGGSVWLGSIIEALQPFGVSDRLVRTSVFRLAKQGWLVSERIGRRSFYRLTDRGLRRFQEASRRIYAEPRENWRGDWSLVLLGDVEGESREEIRKELGWLGFAPFSSNVMAHPSIDIATVESCLAEIAGSENALVMQGRPYQSQQETLKSIVRRAWQLDDLSQRYATFLEQFRPACIATKKDATVDAATAFCVRVLLVHEYRRVLLRDPSLPRALLPQRWNGAAAYNLCHNLYGKLVEPAEQYLMENVENEFGPLPPADPDFFKRFGGYDDA